MRDGSTSMTLQEGTRLEIYQVILPLGPGETGEAYLAYDARLDSTVAIRIVASNSCRDIICRQRFEREVPSVASLAHTNIWGLNELGRDGTIDYLMLKHHEGRRLAAGLDKGLLSMRESR